MPSRRFALLLALFASLVLAAPAQAIVSGRAVTTGASSYPWQVAVVTSSSANDDEQWLCGGTLVAEHLVLTAAHCVIEDDGRIVPPANIYALNGSTNMRDNVATAEDPAIMSFTRVAGVSLYPGIDLSGTVPSGDLALLRLEAAPPLGRPLPVVNASQIGVWAVGQRLRVTGWGVVSETSVNPVDDLRWASVFRASDERCLTAYGADFDVDTMFCALGEPLPQNPTGPVGDTCRGDSGGPIMAALTDPTLPTQPTNPDAWTLVGVTSWGTGCGDPDFPGVYTRLGNAVLRAFATDPDPVASPVNVAPPSMPASAAVGSVVTCAPGTWTGAGVTYTFEFHRVGAGGTSTVVQTGPSNTYTVAPADVSGLVCVVLARNAGGTTWAQSGPTPVTPASAPPTQVPGTQPPRAPSPVPVPDTGGQSGAVTDGAAPRASRARASCKRRRCTVTVRVTDPAPSSGIRRVTGTVTYRATCRKRGRRTTCTRTARVSGRRVTGSTWRLSLPRLPRGTASISVTATDRAGRTQRTPVKLRFRVR